MKNGKEKQKMTLLLTGETIALIREYAQDVLGSDSISSAVRSMAKEYERKKAESKTNH